MIDPFTGKPFDLGLYVLEGREPRKVMDTLVWAQWLEQHWEARFVAQDWLMKTIKVSTIFLGLDHNFDRFSDGDHQPILFETMVFYHDDRCNDQWRHHTYDEAERFHATLLRELRPELAAQTLRSREMANAVLARLKVGAKA